MSLQTYRKKVHLQDGQSETSQLTFPERRVFPRACDYGPPSPIVGSRDYHGTGFHYHHNIWHTSLRGVDHGYGCYTASGTTGFVTSTAMPSLASMAGQCTAPPPWQSAGVPQPQLPSPPLIPSWSLWPAWLPNWTMSQIDWLLWNVLTFKVPLPFHNRCSPRQSHNTHGTATHWHASTASRYPELGHHACAGRPARADASL